MSCDPMSEYYKMCIAAGLNYYRRVPNIDDLINLSGWNTKTFIDLYNDYTHYQKTFPFNIDERVVLKIIMEVNYGLKWDGKTWFDEHEGEISIFDFWSED